MRARWYQWTIRQVTSNFSSNIKSGLSAERAMNNLHRYGKNVLARKSERGWVRIFLEQFTNPLIYILLVAAAIIFVFGKDPLDAFIISGVIFFNAIIGTIQEGRTADILKSLEKLIKTSTVVIRDGQTMILDDENLCPGDLIVLQEGSCVPADARVVEAYNLQIDQSILTGESLPAQKIIEPIAAEKKEIDEQTNMVFRGTYIVTGSGKAIIVATGKNTEIGQIQEAIAGIETDIPLRRDVDKLSYFILLFILVVCVFLFGIGYLAGTPLQELLVMLTALFICVVPEGLPIVLTLVLVSGVHRMAKKRVLVKNMQAVEALGRTDVIVMDKTGTLTRNEMMVSRVYCNDIIWQVSGRGYHPEGLVTNSGRPATFTSRNDHIAVLGVSSILLSNTDIEYQKETGLFLVKGDPTEAALYIFAQKLGLKRDVLEKDYKKLYEVPFSSHRKFHVAFYKCEADYYAFMIGAPEEVFSHCEKVSDDTHAIMADMLEDGLRTIAVAYKKIDIYDLPYSRAEKEQPEVDELLKIVNAGMTFVAVCGLEDSIRLDLRSIVSQTRSAGLRLVMATGDHQKTALYVAKQIGLYQEGDLMFDGPQLDMIDDKELQEQVQNVTIFSRVSPLHKMRIIKALHAHNKIVAMTGDGVNDVPSLVAADLGIAMGSIGTEIAKNAADMVLLNDSFVGIVEAIKQGRHIFYTLRRVILYFFATNLGEILIILFAFMYSIFSGTLLPLPLTAPQILWLNLVTDGFLDVALSMEKEESGLLSRKWLEDKPKLVDRSMLMSMFFFAIPMGIVSLTMFMSFYEQDLTYARTMTLITMAMFQWFNAWNCRSQTKSIFSLGLFSNKWLILATLFVLGLQFSILHVPILQIIFKTTALGFHDWAIIVCSTFPIVLLEELRKYFIRARVVEQ